MPLALPDLRPFRPFVRHALTNALLLVLGGAFGVLALVESASWGLVLAFWTGTLVVIAVGLYVWLRPVARLVGAEKRRELDWCQEALVRERARLGGEDPRPTRLAELVAWERRISAVGEWPIDAPALRRILLYSLIPLGSWAGGALMERFIDTLLG